MKEQAKKLLYLVGRERLVGWVAVALLAVAVGGMELVGGLLIFVLLSSLTAPGSGLEIPLVGRIRDGFPQLSDESFLLWTATLVGIFFVVRAAVFLFQSYLQNRLAQNAGVRLATRLLRSYLDMPYAFHLRRNSSELIRNVHGSVHQIVVLGFTPIVVLVSETLLIVGVFVALLLVSAAGTMLTLVAIGPLVLLLLKVIKRGMRKWGRVHQDMSGTTLRVLQESLHALRDIKILGKERYFESRFAAARAQLARAIYMQGLLSALPRVTTETMLVVFIVVFLGVAISTGRPVADLLALFGTFGYAGLRLMPSVNRIVTNANNLQFSRAAVEDVYSELVTLEDVAVAAGGADEIRFHDRVVVDELSFSYEGGDAPVVDGISFSLAKGESIGIVGSTGAGKSTLLDIMLGLLRPTAGTVTVDGVPIHSSPASWQRMLGVVPQATFLIDDTLRRNIALGLGDDEIDEDRVRTAATLAQLDDFIQTLPDNLGTVVGERGIRLSGGQRQRVAIARALYRDPEVIFFDEATASLDNITEAKLLEGIERLYGDHTVVMVAHRLSTVRRCDRILLLEQGRLVDSGTFDALLERNRLFQDMAR